MDTTIRYLLFFACVFLLVLGMLTARAMARTRGWKPAAVFVTTRIMAVGLLVYLGIQALGGFETHVVPPAAQGKRKVILLADRSYSMEFPLANTTVARGEVVEESLAAITKRLDADGGFEWKRIDFANNYVESEFSDDLRRDASRLGHALTGALTRFEANAVVIVSDGASTDGNPPDYVFDWARNRTIGLYAVGVGDASESFDARVAKVDGLRENPDVLSARVQCRGQGAPDRLVVRLLIDGRQVQSQRIEPGPLRTVSFVLPKVAQGWHEYLVEVESPKAETCLQNNRWAGVFRQSPPRKILLLYTTPSADYRHLSRFLRLLYPGQVVATSVFDRRVDSIDADDLVFLVLGDVAPKHVPAGVLAAMKKKQLPTLFLPGDSLAAWVKSDVGGFPLHTVGSYRSAIKLRPRIARSGRSSWGAEDFNYLRPTGFREATSVTDAVELLSLKTSAGTFPFLVADAAKKARFIVLLCGSSWRWSMSPDSRVRSSFRGLWRRISALAVDPSETGQSLKLEVSKIGEKSIGIAVMHEDETRTSSLSDVVVEKLGSGVSIDDLELREGVWKGSTEGPDRAPSVSWFKATATLDGLPVESTQVAYVMNPDGAEFIDTVPHHGELQSWLADPSKDFAAGVEVDALVDRLIERTQLTPTTETIRHRDWRMELTIGVIMLLVFCADWLLERNLKEGR